MNETKGVFAVKIVCAGKSPIALQDQQQMIDSGKWFQATRTRYHNVDVYLRPVICTSGFHGYPLIPDNAYDSWRRLANERYDSRRFTRAAIKLYLVKLRGRYVIGRGKIAADQIKFVREINSATRNKLHAWSPDVVAVEMIGSPRGPVLTHVGEDGGYVRFVKSGHVSYTRPGSMFRPEEP